MELLIAFLVALNIVKADDARNLSKEELAKYEIIWGQEADDFKGDGKGGDDAKKYEDEKIIWGQEADDF